MILGKSYTMKLIMIKVGATNHDVTAYIISSRLHTFGVKKLITWLGSIQKTRKFTQTKDEQCTGSDSFVGGRNCNPLAETPPPLICVLGVAYHIFVLPKVW